MKRLLVVCCCVAIVTFIGCKMAPPGSGPAGTSDTQQQITQEQLKLLEDIRSLQQETGQTVQALMQDARQREERALAEQGLPTLVEDIAAAQDVLGDASEAAQLKRPEAARAALDRLSAICTTMLTELPSRRIATHAERALAYLHLPQARLSEASAELTAAYDVCVSSADPPEVQDLISQAKGHLSAGNMSGAGEVLRSIIAKAGAEETVGLLRGMLQGIAGAGDALDRSAWPVVQAELLEVRRMLDDLSQRVQFRESISAVQPSATAGETTTTEGGESETGEEAPAETEPAPAQPSTTEPAPAEPATGTEAPATPQ